MTLEEFRATGRDVADFGAIDDAQGFTGPGRAYLDDGLFIERIADIGDYKWCLTVGSDQRLYALLGNAEDALYQFAVSEGYINA